ncbi:uncharacterized protein LOC135494240 [Lineus longissimus]|uniref:uncharacterized protein LOC135494240 n=1 Tax=Lineus longissimus TaxID=88925 RepID=UPI002B4F5B17
MFCAKAKRMVWNVFLFLLPLLHDTSAAQWYNVFKNQEFYGTTIFSIISLCLPECLSRCDHNDQCVAAMYGKLTAKCTGLSAEGELMNGKINGDVDTCVKYDQWITAFIGQAGIGKKVYTEWVGASFTSVDSKYEPSCNCHYKSELVEKWPTSGIQKVKMSVISSNAEVAYMSFNGKDTDKMSWFSAQHLLNSSWTDLKGGPHNIFSIKGDDVTRNGHPHGRRFFVNKGYGGCDRDYGWLMVLDTAGPSTDCYKAYEKPPIPGILYPASGTSTIWKQAKRADSFKIYVQVRLLTNGP